LNDFKPRKKTSPPDSANPNWDERYYSLTYGPATFIVLDANNSDNSHYDNHQLLPNGSTPDWAPYSEQYYWLIEELKKAKENSAFTFVMFHPAPYSRGIHGQPGEEQSGYNIRILDPLFRNLGVDGVFTSHDHMAERSLTGPPGFEDEMDGEDDKNLNYFVMGNSGYESRAEMPGWENWMSIHNNRGKPYYTVYGYDWSAQDGGGGYGVAKYKSCADAIAQVIKEEVKSHANK